VDTPSSITSRHVHEKMQKGHNGKLSAPIPD
jgi:hypothetical protein